MVKLAVLMQGTMRAANFLCSLLPYIIGDCDYDLYLCLRKTCPGDLMTRIPEREKEFSYGEISSILNGNVFLSVLPPYSEELILKNYVLPVGPMDRRMEVRCIAMFLGIFAGVKQIKNSGVAYDYVIRTRTDYLFWDAPVFNRGISILDEYDKAFVVDSQRTRGFRYQDNPNIPWQGSVSDLFSFSSYKNFIKLWDFEDILHTIWTGVPETTLFRNILLKFTGETVQHFRKNESFLQRYFYIVPGEFRESKYYFRHYVLPDSVKLALLKMIEDASMAPNRNLSIVRATYNLFECPSEAAKENLKSLIRDLSSIYSEVFFSLLEECQVL